MGTTAKDNACADKKKKVKIFVPVRIKYGASTYHMCELIGEYMSNKKK